MFKIGRILPLSRSYRTCNHYSLVFDLMRILNALAQKHNNAFAITLACVVIAFTGCSSAPQKPADTSHANTKNTSKNTTASKTYKRSTPLKYSKGLQIVSIADSLIGSPYKYGGSSPQGFDCSGLVYYTHQQLDITVPRTSRQQAQHRPSKQLSAIQPGDILFFRLYGSTVSHVGIYAGNNQFIHAPKSGRRVSYASLNDPFWSERLVKVSKLH